MGMDKVTQTQGTGSACLTPVTNTSFKDTCINGLRTMRDNVASGAKWTGAKTASGAKTLVKGLGTIAIYGALGLVGLGAMLVTCARTEGGRFTLAEVNRMIQSHIDSFRGLIDNLGNNSSTAAQLDRWAAPGPDGYGGRE